MSKSLEKTPSSTFLKSPTTKMFQNDPSNSATEGARHRRVDDESSIEKQYTFGEVLGTGAFGVVKEVTNKLTKEKFAMKMVQKDKPGSSSIQLLEREVEVLKRVNHPHIIKLEEVFETAKKMYLIMELCKGGELSNKLRKRGYFKEEEAKVIMRQLTEALVYMHDNDMVHRDLKLENILLSTADPNDEFNIKVTDFGLAHMKGLQGCDDLMHTRCGTLYYMAPEVFNGHEYTKMCDVWSLGVIMYILLCGHVPFNGETAAKLEELILQGELTFQEIEWISVSSVAKDLIKSMLCVDTSARYTARKILDDPWFTGKTMRTMNALDLMRTLELESGGTDSITPGHSLDSIPESKSPTDDKQTAANSSNSPRKISSPEKKAQKPAMRNRAHSIASVSSRELHMKTHTTSTSSVHGRLSSTSSSTPNGKHKSTKSAVLSTKRPASGKHMSKHSSSSKTYH